LQKERELGKKKESNLVTDAGSAVYHSLTRMAEVRPDIFGGDEMESKRKVLI
jgi:hypothetical protein